MLRFGNDQVASPAHYSHGFIFNQLFVAQWVFWINFNESTLGL
jgi:hypothetical protein